MSNVESDGLACKEFSFSPGDVLAALLYLSGICRIEGDVAVIYRGVRAARELSPLLQQFVFAPGGTFPFSMRLEEAMGRLLLGEILVHTPTAMSIAPALLISEEARRYIATRILPLFTESELAELREAGTIFALVCA